MIWDDYAALMRTNSRPVYATSVGHHGVYAGVEKTSPTVYPHREDTPEMRLDWVMQREVYPYLSGIKEGAPLRVFWLEHRSTLFLTMLGDITRRLAAEGYLVEEQDHWGDRSLRITLP